MSRFINRDNLSKSEVKRIYGRTKKGLVSHIYQAQKDTSKRRGYKKPSYSKDELYDWLNAQVLFHELYNKWKAEEFCSNLRPSIDRIDDYKGYTFYNIQLMTLGDNNTKPKLKQCKGVIQMTRHSKKIINSFPSSMEASRQTGIDNSTIRKVVNGKRTHAGGYYWTSARED